LERLAIKIWWQGYSGMKLRNLKPNLRTISSFEEAPDIIVLHCGGNDLGQHSIGDLRELAKSQLQYAATLFPTTKIIKKYCPEVIGDIPKILQLWTVFVSD
jgi:hypothetical protein